VIGYLPPRLRDIATHQLTNPTLDLRTDPVEAVHLTPKDTHVRSSPIFAPGLSPNPLPSLSHGVEAGAHNVTTSRLESP
jgi:hypothetical protein